MKKPVYLYYVPECNEIVELETPPPGDNPSESYLRLYFVMDNSVRFTTSEWTVYLGEL